MDLTYNYTKLRKSFGRQPMFCETPVYLLDSINPDISLQKKYCLRNPVNSESQATKLQSENHVNTQRVTYQDLGVNHVEGGWPKEVNFNDEEMTARYRRRVEREDNYVDAVLEQHKKFEHYIKQNNATEVYEMYFKSMPSVQPIEKHSLRVNNVYKDLNNNRPVVSMDWTSEDDPKVAIAYCDKRYPILRTVNSNSVCYLWDLENPHYPLQEFEAPTACWQIACSPYQPSIIIGGLEDGRICVFDLRYQKMPIAFSPMHLAHRDPVSALLYMQSRLNTEFFSGSSDGKCMWWDIRNISAPSDILVMTVKIPPGEQVTHANSEGVSALQYDRSFPTRFLCGTDTGIVINVNRKGKSHQEIMSAVFLAQKGPVRTVHRSPCTSKMFITCGDWTVNIWSDDVHTSPIVTGMPHRYQVYDVVWAPQRVSSYMSVCGDGKFRYWDLLRKYREPVIVLPLAKHPLLKIKPHEEGRLIAIGDVRGTMYLLSLSENLVLSGDKDKQLMIQTYERESRREHILESRIKEIRLKQKAEEEAASAPHTEIIDEESLVKIAEDEYKRVVSEEIRNMGYTPTSAAKKDVMRKR
ncbi:hypothetical protein K1T71_007253 [Dendrolimus kikuchii]|uniref:Uncharacterized protein n=1 Tax=Dendrolimus kikuchii TaxID=765133 RepID=A0ACC1CZX5_9NEOP|nr:hypothetical protein K1T71_007253 [Dendrolimus kikuchii]